VKIALREAARRSSTAAAGNSTPMGMDKNKEGMDNGGAGLAW